LNHWASGRFWESYNRLPVQVRELADRSFERLKANPSHPGLHFKKIGRFWSARVGLFYRALAVEVPDGLLWIWIGDHDEYERLLERQS
jgi:hypothetical protein